MVTKAGRRQFCRIPYVLLCLWPGLSPVWLLGSGMGLIVSIGFTLAFNLALVATFAWSEWVGSSACAVGWGGLAVLWIVSVIVSRIRLAKLLLSSDPGAQQDLLRQAQSEYLIENWEACESNLKRLLRANPQDVEAQLTLATVYRRTQRSAEAHAGLRQLDSWEEADKWRSEIRREREWLNRAGATTGDLPEAA